MSDARAELVHELLLVSVRSTPDAPAVVNYLDGDVEVWTYRQLQARVDACVLALDEAGLDVGDRVIVESHNCGPAIVLFLACSTLGLAFVPVSPELPELRRRTIVEISDAALFVHAADVDRADLPASTGTGVLDGSGLTVKRAVPSRRRHPRPVVNTDIAYMIFTSGTTGRPKGVVMSHRGVVAFYRGMLAAGFVAADDRIASTSPLQFDFALLDIGLALGSGAAIVPVPRDVQRWPRRLIRCLHDTEATWLDAVPSVWRPVLRHEPALIAGLTRLRGTVFTGESFPLAELRRLRELRPGLRVVNCFGSTESMAASLTEVPDTIPADGQRLSIGFAHAGADFLLLGQDGAAVRDEGVIGELYLRSPALFTGYWADPEATREALVPDPLNPRSGQLLFRSRDLAYRGPAGELYFCGRADTLVKVRGNRVELAEVESRLLEFPGVVRAVVLPGSGPDDSLAAFVVQAAIGAAVTDTDVIAFCHEYLPDYMAPSRVWLLEELPLNQNGKIDRRALAALAAGGSD